MEITGLICSDKGSPSDFRVVRSCMILLSTFATIPCEDRRARLWKLKRKEENCGGNNLKGFYCSTNKLGRHASRSPCEPGSSKIRTDFSTTGLTPFSPP